MTDSALVRAAAAGGDREAFGRLVGPLRGELLADCYRAVLLLREVLGVSAAAVAGLLETRVAVGLLETRVAAGDEFPFRGGL